MGTKVGLALQKGSTVSEKIRILTWLPSSLTKTEISSLFPDITIYMIEKAKSLLQEKGVYSEPEAYTDHPIDESTEKIVMESPLLKLMAMLFHVMLFVYIFLIRLFRIFEHCIQSTVQLRARLI